MLYVVGFRPGQNVHFVSQKNKFVYLIAILRRTEEYST